MPKSNSSSEAPSSLLKNTSWLLSIEGAAKVARFVTIIAMAAFLAPADYGLAILCLAIHDVFRLLMRAGSGTQVIQCSEQSLPSYCENATAIQWLLCLALAVAQYLLAPIIADFYAMQEATSLLQIMALSYLFYPAVSVRVFLLQRQHRFKEFSVNNGICIVTENLTIAVLLWFDFGIVAIAYAKVLCALLWFALFIRVDVKTFGIGLQLAVVKVLLKTSSLLMLTELSKAAKQNADVFIGGRILPPEIFGFYTFARSASTGMSQSFINAFQGALLPYLAQRNRLGEEQKSSSTFILASGLSAIFVIQALLAPIYVPILFGEQWQTAIFTCSILCLSAIPNLWFDTFCSSLKAQAKYDKELLLRVCYLVIFVTGLVVIAPATPASFALYVTSMSSFITLLLLTANRLVPTMSLSKNC